MCPGFGCHLAVTNDSVKNPKKYREADAWNARTLLTAVFNYIIPSWEHRISSDHHS